MSTIAEIDPTRCIHNKFQPRSRTVFSDTDLADLESIKTRGLDYPILVYKDPDPKTMNLYVVMDGWRRISAWIRWRPGELIRAEVRPVPTDRELFETAVVTNEGRENLNAIQKADLLAQGIELGLTQAQAGKLFNPPLQQAAVSHLLSLRKLPDAIKVHVESGAIPERIARQLVTPAKHMQPQVIKAANAIAKSSPEEKENVARYKIGDIYSSDGRHLNSDYITPWKLDWPAEPLDVPDAKPDKGEPGQIPACTDCPFNVEYEKRRYCVRPACHAVKLRIWNEQQKAKQAADLIASPKRQVSDWERKDKARRKLLNEHNKQSRALVAAAAPTIATALPIQPIVLDLMFEAVKFIMREPARKAEVKWKAATSDERRVMIANLLISKRLDLGPWKDSHPDKTKIALVSLASILKVKLPKGWDQPARPAKAPTPKRAKRARKEK
jgi:ParB/RepB/Spo0J family partition protein